MDNNENYTEITASLDPRRLRILRHNNPGETLTAGQEAVALRHNTQGSNRVDLVKLLGAELIDLANDSAQEGANPRSAAEAKTLIETGIMWLVKGITNPVKNIPQSPGISSMDPLGLKR